jgi:O-antigen ligase
LKLQRAVFYCLLLALISYGFHYHLAKAFIHLTALLSIVNILLALKDRSLARISTSQPTILMMGTLSISAFIIFIYFMVYNNPISERHFASTFYPALFFAIILPSLKIEKTDKNIILYSGIIACIAMAGSGIVDYLSNGHPAYRTSGFLNMPIIYASCMAILTSWISAEFFRGLSNRRWGLASLCLVAICTGLSAILFTGSRGPIIASIIVFLALLLHYIMSLPSTKNKLYTFLILIGISSLIILFLPQSGSLDNIKNRFQQGIDNISTGFEEGKRQYSPTGLRLDMWEASLVTISDHPLTGIGPGSHAEYFSMLDQEKRININTSSVIRFDHMHNDFIQSWLTKGLVFGTMALFFIIYPALLFATRIKSYKLAIIGLSICSGFILCGLTDVAAHKASSLTLFLLLISLQLALLNNHRETNEKT